MGSWSPAIGFALGSACLFGLSTPLAKMLLAVTDPALLAGLLYLGSGVGLAGYRATLGLRREGRREASIKPRDAPWLTAAILTGGVIGPLLLMFGLAGISAGPASLLLNLEGIFTAALAWLAFGEHYTVRIVTGMAAIGTGAVVLSWDPSSAVPLDPSALLVIGACAAWALDNNFTRRVSASDPVQIAALKGMVAGTVNLVIARAGGAPWPTTGVMLGAGAVGLFGYGTSLVLFVLALRHLGASRTVAYFSTAPFVGALGAIVILHETVTSQLFIGGAFMAIGVWLHLTERHEHEHVHDRLEHDHLHSHDQHHQHAHPTGVPSDEPHAHVHMHTPLRHSHPHYPDLHHRHGH